jgi:PTS system nitrogen regulatory IIA component
MDIKDFLSPAAALIEVRASDKVGLLQDLANRLALPLDSPSTIVAAALLKREQLGSTGTGKGIATPHALISTLKKPLGILVRLNEAIEFDAIDGKPVDLVFALLLPGPSS